MISVCININGNFLMGRSARNLEKQDNEGFTLYQCDDGQIIKHRPKDGVIVLAKKMLNTIKED